MKAFLTGPALQIVLCTTLLASNQISAQTPAPKSTAIKADHSQSKLNTSLGGAAPAVMLATPGVAALWEGLIGGAWRFVGRVP